MEWKSSRGPHNILPSANQPHHGGVAGVVKEYRNKEVRLHRHLYIYASSERMEVPAYRS
jgi:hypothetical protein